MSAEDEVKNVIEILMLRDEEVVLNNSDEEVVLNKAACGKISPDAIKKLFKEGLTSMEAMLLLEDEDLKRTKILRGQQKLILAAVRKLLKQLSAQEIPCMCRRRRAVTSWRILYPAGRDLHVI